MTMNFVGTGARLTAADVDNAAHLLVVEAAVVWAVSDVESAGGGFLPDKRPKILFEAHVFGRLTGHRYDASHPNVSAPRWDRSLYGAAGAHQYDRLAQASALDATAALESASWGMFQLLGLNFARCGAGSVVSFVQDAVRSEGAQLDQFAAFCRTGGLDKPLRDHDWTRFAILYNGAGEASNHYHQKLAAAYARRVAVTPRDHAVVAARVEDPGMIGRSPVV